MNRRSLGWRLAATAALGSMIALATTAQADQQDQAFLQQNDRVSGLLEKADGFARVGDWRSAVERLMEAEDMLAAGATDETVRFVHPAGPAGVFVGAEEAIGLRVARLPAEAIAVYRSSVDPRAAEALARAESAGSDEAIAAVFAEYPLASAGVLALEKVGLRALEAGDLEAAARAFDRLARMPRTLVEGTGVDLPRLDLRRFAVRVLARDADGAAEVAASLRGAQGGAAPTLKLGRAPAQTPEQWVAALRKGSGTAAVAAAPFRVARNLRSTLGQWVDLDATHAARYAASGLHAPLPSLPVVVGDQVVVCDNKSVQAIDISTGQIGLFVDQSNPASQPTRLHDVLARPAVAGDLVIFSADLGLPPDRIEQEAPLDEDGNPQEGGEKTVTLEPQPNHRVIAVSRSKGDVVWDTGLLVDGGGAALAKEAIAFSAPVVAGDRVFVTATVSKSDLQSHLVALDLATGEIIFRTFICSTSPHNYLRIAASAAPPVLAGGAVVVQTNLGVVAALDPVDGRFLWAHRYPVYPQRAQADYIEAGRRFALQPPVAAGGVVYAAPRDSNWLIAIDAETGRMEWRFARDLARRVLGVVGDRLLVAGDRVIALDRRGGAVVAESEALGGDGVQATSVIAGGTALVPTNEGIVEVDVETLAVSGRYYFADPAAEVGHLALIGGPSRRLVSVGAGRVHVYEDMTALQRTEEGRGPFGELSLGEVAVRRGQRTQAIRRLERAIGSNQLGPAQVDRAHQLIVEAALRIADSSGDDLEKLSWACERVFRNRPSAPEHLAARRLIGEALIGAKRGAEATVHLQAILDEEKLRGEILTLPSGTAVRASAYARARLEHVIDTFGRDTYAEQDRAAGQLVADARKTGTKTLLEDVLRRFPVSVWAPEARLLLAEHYEAKGLVSAAAPLLEEYLEHDAEPEDRPDVIVRLIEAYEAMRRWSAARRAIDVLVEEHAGARVAMPDGTDVTVVDFVRARLGRAEYLNAEKHADTIASLQLPLERLWRTSTDLLGTDSEVVVPQRRPLGETILLVRRGLDLEARDLHSGIFLWRKQKVGRLGRRRMPGWAGGHLFLADHDGVSALRSRAGTEAFRIALRTPAAEGGAGEGEGQPGVGPDRNREWGDGPRLGPDAVHAVAFAADRVVVLTGWNELRGYDAETGEEVWRRPFEARLSGDLLVEGARAIVATRQPARLIGVDMVSGEVVYNNELGEGKPQDLTGSPVEGDGGLLFMVTGGRTVVCVDGLTGQTRWSRELAYFVGDVRAVPGGDSVVAIAPAVPGQPPFVVLRTDDGRPFWEADLPTDGRVERVFVGPERVYALHARGSDFSLVSHEVRTGKVLWKWRAPSGQAAIDLFETPDHLLLPRTDADGSAAVCVVGKDEGGLQNVLKVPGRRLHSARVVGDVFVLLTDRGDFGLGKVDRDRTWAEVVDLAERAERRPSDMSLRARLADRYFKLREIARAVQTLDDALLTEGLGKAAYGLLYGQLAGMKEALAEAQQVTVEVPRLVRPPEIDGELNDEWVRWAYVKMSGPKRVSLLQRDPEEDVAIWRGDEDLSGRIFIGYDDRALYFAVDIQDMHLRPYDSEADTWVGDCLLIALDPRNDGGYWFARDDTLLSLALTLPRKKKDEEQGEDAEKNKPEGRYFVKRKDDGTGAVYEAEIPWSVLAQNGAKVPPPERLSGFTFGFNLVVTDDDGDRDGDGLERGATKYLAITPGILLHKRKDRLWQGFIPEHFPRITLR